MVATASTEHSYWLALRLPMQALAFLAVFIYATQAIAFEWKPGFSASDAVKDLRFEDKDLKSEDKTRTKTCKPVLKDPRAQGLSSRTTTLLSGCGIIQCQMV